MKKSKRIFILIITVIILVNSIQVPAYAAVDNLILDNSYNRYIIGSLLVASGMVYSNTQQLNDSINEYIDNWNDHETGWKMPDGGGGSTWQDIINGITVGSKVVYDMNTGKLKQVINMSNDLIDYVQDWVNMKYQQLENWITQPSYWLFNWDTTVSYYLPTENLKYYVYYIKSDGSFANSRYPYYVQYNSSTGYYQGASGNDIKSPIRLYCWSTPGSWCVDTAYQTQQSEQITLGSGTASLLVTLQPVQVGIPNSPLPDNTTTDESTGYGNPDAVDNPNYTYTHNSTGMPTITVPLKTDETAMPQIDNDGYFVPDSDDDDLVGIGVGDISSSDTSGVEIPNPTTTPTPTPSPFPDTTIPDTATDTDFDSPNRRALYQLKFPFSLPWDIKAVFTLLRAPAKAPKWDIDVVTPELKGKIGITGETKFTFDMGEFELVGQVTRWFTFIGFCLTLIWVTRFIIRS